MLDSLDFFDIIIKDVLRYYKCNPQVIYENKNYPSIVNMEKKEFECELSEKDIIEYDEIVLSDEGCNHCRNEAHFSPRGYKKFVDYYHAGVFYKRYTEFSKFNSQVTFDYFLDVINSAIKLSKEDKTVKVWGVKNS